MKQSNRPALITLTVSALLLSAAVAQQNPQNQTPPPSGNSGGNSNQNGSQNGAGSPSTPGNQVNQGGVGQSSTPSTPKGAPVNSPTVLCNLAGNPTTGTVPGSNSSMNSGTMGAGNSAAGSAGNTAGSGNSGSAAGSTGGSTSGSGSTGTTTGNSAAGSAGSGSNSGSTGAGSAGSAGGSAGTAGSGSGSTTGTASSGSTAAGTTSTPGSTTTSTPSTTASTPSTAAGSGNAASGSKSALNETDRCFIDQAGLSGLFEVQSSSVALNQASDAQVKAFARRMVADHTKANTELKTLATSLGHKPPTSLDPAKAQQVANMKAQQGKNFDSAYMTAQLTGHEQTVNLFSNYADQGTNPQLKQFAKKTLPILVEHWKMAQEMVGTTSTSK
ncbi:DUF4142 domain-containing protein [Deinococcus sonorensis]|uniref:DUF4142 domain-containing protein n=2 Tax=Deinococcus sonorensis TaxID=309891 RepID=A0AAU7UAX2_9DEIO